MDVTIKPDQILQTALQSRTISIRVIEMKVILVSTKSVFASANPRLTVSSCVLVSCMSPRLLTSKHTFWLALLSAHGSNGNVLLPWTKQVISGMHALFNASAQIRDLLRCFKDSSACNHIYGSLCSCFCLDLMLRFIKSKSSLFVRCVHKFSFVGSVLDRAAIPEVPHVAFYFCDKWFRFCMCSSHAPY